MYNKRICRSSICYISDVLKKQKRMWTVTWQLTWVELTWSKEKIRGLSNLDIQKGTMLFCMKFGISKFALSHINICSRTIFVTCSSNMVAASCIDTRCIILSRILQITGRFLFLFFFLMEILDETSARFNFFFF